MCNRGLLSILHNNKYSFNTIIVFQMHFECKKALEFSSTDIAREHNPCGYFNTHRKQHYKTRFDVTTIYNLSNNFYSIYL